jgi:hypothetical protein
MIRSLKQRQDGYELVAEVVQRPGRLRFLIMSETLQTRGQMAVFADGEEVAFYPIDSYRIDGPCLGSDAVTLAHFLPVPHGAIGEMYWDFILRVVAAP